MLALEVKCNSLEDFVKKLTNDKSGLEKENKILDKEFKKVEKENQLLKLRSAVVHQSDYLSIMTPSATTQSEN